MKKIKLLPIFAILFSSLIFTGCDGDGDSDNVPVGTFKVDFDGQTFVAETTQAIVNEEYISITGFKSGTGEVFQFTIPNGTVGTYNWNGYDGYSIPAPLALIYNSGDDSDVYIAASDEQGEFSGVENYVDTAELKITSINTSNNTITGTFKFTGIRYNMDTNTFETKVFSNGSFNLTYAADSIPVNTNTFFAKINGQDFAPTSISAYKLGGMLYLIGRKGPIENIFLVVNQNIAPGTYNIELYGTGPQATYILDNSAQGTFPGDGGTVVISSHNLSQKRIIGTFQFQATSSYNVTQGSFDIKY